MLKVFEIRRKIDREFVHFAPIFLPYSFKFLNRPGSYTNDGLNINLKTALNMAPILLYVNLNDR
jgi:hypothetical protein